MLMLMMVSEHEIWQSVHWLLPVGCIFTVISCSLILFGSFSVPGTLLCAKTPSCGLGVCSVGFQLLNAYVFNVSASQMFYPVWERFSDCQMRHFFFFFLSSFLHLFSDPDIATEHMYCIAGQTLSSHGPSPALLLNHCACEALYWKDCLHTAGVWSLSLEQGGGEDAIHFVLPLALLSGTWAVF